MWDYWYNSGVSFVLGLVLLVLGGIPLLNGFGILPFGLPGFLTGIIASVFLYLCALGGIWLLIDAWFEDASDMMRWSSVIVGLIVLVLGVVPLLNQFGVIGFSIPGLSMTIYNAIFLVEGVLLVIGAFSL